VLPILAVQWLARLLNAIEAGTSWPQQTKWGMPFFLPKVQGFTTDPHGVSGPPHPGEVVPQVGRLAAA
jgi:hypothetical protein